ncbi:hypothetical protein K2Z83_06490 [Oscillochloris sp. ZM17-4]|uniref:hypothetical protein n=1 Tax=Oscillochloris sp. ZM17-4 TaxID=2866714 RepID=UPI001C73163A|nr:hypothetical protein [Oscillochloris sp. ZM17-4]MBX0327323.1 hypothetical protein [Oscillochloris sp. ZM17-4]
MSTAGWSAPRSAPARDLADERVGLVVAQERDHAEPDGVIGDGEHLGGLGADEAHPAGLIDDDGAGVEGGGGGLEERLSPGVEVVVRGRRRGGGGGGGRRRAAGEQPGDHAQAGEQADGEGDVKQRHILWNVEC